MGRNFFSSPKFPSWLWGTPNLMFSMYISKDHVSRGRVPGSWSHLLQSLRHGSMAAYFLRLWVQIPPGAWMSVCCECCVLSGRGLCDESIAPPEESYLCGVSECDLKTLTMRRPRPTRVVEPLKKKEWLGHEAGHLHLSSAEVKNEWSYISFPPCIHCVQRNK